MTAVRDGASFDFVIVGAGAAGCVLASRLSEDPSNSVCLIEAGGHNTDYRVAMPAAALALAEDASAKNWAFATAPQVHLEGRRLTAAAGRGWGGSTAIGNMIQLAPTDDKQAEEVRGYFSRIQTPAEQEPVGAKGEIARAFVESAVEAGYKRARDFSSARDGAGYFPLSIRDGARVHASDAYLRPIFGIRSNLAVISHAFVTHIRIEEGRACAASYATGIGRRVRRTVYARCEIILCAGAYQTPKLLMLSGVGEREALAALGVPVLVGAPEVGRNLLDRCAIDLAFECPLPVTRHADTREVSALSIATKYRLHRRGKGRRAYLEAGGFFRTRGEVDAADVEMYAIAALPSELARLERDGFTIRVSLTRPASRGQVRLACADPYAPPNIDPNFLESEGDMRTLSNGVRMARDIAGKPDFGLYRGREIAPGQGVRTDGEVDRWVRAHAHAMHYPIGSCRVGDDSEAVLDRRLCVRGVDSLRVVDASALSAPPDAEPAAAVMALAEHAADLILNRVPAHV